MNMQIHASGFTAAAELKEFLNEKFNKLETFYDKIISVDVYLKLESHSQVKEKIVDVKMNIPGTTLFSTEAAKTFEEAIDTSVDVLSRQLKRHKDKSRQKV